MNFRRCRSHITAFATVVGENSISRNYIVMIRIGSVLVSAADFVLLVLLLLLLLYFFYNFHYYFIMLFLLKRALHNALDKRGKKKKKNGYYYFVVRTFIGKSCKLGIFLKIYTEIFYKGMIITW